MSNTIKFYRSLLLSADIHVNDEDMLMYGDNPVSIALASDSEDVRPLVLPTKRVQRLEEDGTTFKFHPISESIFRGQSEVFSKLQLLLGARILKYIVYFGEHILAMAQDTDSHASMSTSQISVLTRIGKVPRSTTGFWNKVWRNTSGVNGATPVTKFISNKVDDTSRETILVPSLIEDSTPMLIAGQRPSAKSAGQAVFNIIDIIFDYLKGHGVSDSKSAPYFISLLMAYGDVLVGVKKLAKELGLQDLPEFKIEKAWISGITKIEDWAAKEIPAVYEGNVGVSFDGEDDKPSNGSNTPKSLQPVAPAISSAVGAVNSISDNVASRAQQTPVRPKPKQINAPTFKPRGGNSPSLKKSAESQDSSHGPSARVNRAPAQQRHLNSDNYRNKFNRAPKAPSSTTVQSDVVYDVYGHPLLCADGSPLTCPVHEMPLGVVQAVDQNGTPLFNSNGTPVLDEVDNNYNAAPQGYNSYQPTPPPPHGYQPQQGYNGYQPRVAAPPQQPRGYSGYQPQGYNRQPPVGQVTHPGRQVSSLGQYPPQNYGQQMYGQPTPPPPPGSVPSGHIKFK